MKMRTTAFYLMACCLMLSMGVAVVSGSESIDGLLAMNSSSQTTLNQTACNYTASNCTSNNLSSSYLESSPATSSDNSSLSSESSGAGSPDFNSSKMVSSFFDSLDLNSTSDRYQSGPSDLESWDYSDDYYDSALFSEPQSKPQVLRLAFPAADLNGDNAIDLLITNVSSDASTGIFSSEISVLSGNNGSTLWQRDYPSSLVLAQTAGELNGDGLADIMVNEILSSGSLIPYSSISAVCGINGTIIWSRSQILALTIAYPVQDSSASDSSQFLVHVIGMDSMNNRIFTSIARVNGSDGTNIDERMFSDALAIEYPAGNLTDDQVQDSIIAIYQLNGSLTSGVSDSAGGAENAGEDAPLNITATAIEARDGLTHKTLWNCSFACPALAMPTVDLTGDERDDVLIYLLNYSEYGLISSDIVLLDGSNGEVLWKQSFSGLVLATPGPDLTGEGLRDLIVYNWGDTENANMLAVKGDDGKVLWIKEGMIFIPS
jgi:hypothetical protein